MSTQWPLALPVHSQVGHLGHFHFLAIKIDAARSSDVQVFARTLGAELQGHMEALGRTILGTVSHLHLLFLFCFAVQGKESEASQGQASALPRACSVFLPQVPVSRNSPACLGAQVSYDDHQFWLRSFLL